MLLLCTLLKHQIAIRPPFQLEADPGGIGRTAAASTGKKAVRLECAFYQLSENCSSSAPRVEFAELSVRLTVGLTYSLRGQQVQ